MLTEEAAAAVLSVPAAPRGDFDAITCLAYAAHDDSVIAACRLGGIAKWSMQRYIEDNVSTPLVRTNLPLRHVQSLATTESRVVAACADHVAILQAADLHTDLQIKLPQRCVASTMSAETVYAAAPGGTVMCAELASGRLRVLGLDAATPVSCIHVYDNSTMLALGTRDGRVLLYDLRSEECTASLRVGCDTACVTTNPDNTWIATGGFAPTRLFSLARPHEHVVEFKDGNAQTLGFNWATEQLLSYGNYADLNILNFDGSITRSPRASPSTYCAVHRVNEEGHSLLVSGGEGLDLSVSPGPKFVYVMQTPLSAREE